uniref:Uncharacterized protein n=1 Tax=Mycena chlorophos TaxID=658473 RepID=A0ABQ0LB45_MYCCL|nr:predicted protein [Mycena chlorophos]
MGKSAKLHKRTKKTSSASHTPAAVASKPQAQTQAIQAAKKKAGLKAAGSKPKSKNTNGGHVLGGADYVDLMMGSRRRACEEAAKLPQDA